MAVSKKDILDYISHTLENTNINVLGPMLDEFETGDNKQEIELSATENKVYTPASGKVYNKVTVSVPQPTGKITIEENGTNIDIAQYATADVTVSGGVETYTYELYDLTEEENLHIFVPDVGATSCLVQELYKSDFATETYGFMEGRNYISILGEIPNGYELYIDGSDGATDLLQYDSTYENGRYYIVGTEDTFGLSFKLRQSS